MLHSQRVRTAPDFEKHQRAERTGTAAGTATASEVGKCSWNNRLEAGIQLRPGAPDPLWSFPVTSLTIYTEDIADTLALKGLGAHSTRVH
jgi:hypothetical protein